MEILEKFTDEAGKFRYVVSLSNGQAQMFKFNEEKTDEEALAEATRFQEAMEQQLIEDNGTTNEN